MQDFKVKHFERDYPGRRFPTFHSLSPTETHQLRTAIAKKAGVRCGTDPLGMTKYLDRQATPVEGVNANGEDFHLSSLLQALGIRSLPDVLINWYHYDAIDRMRLDDASEYFGDIWYSGPDDIDIFDESLSWIVSVDHEGMIKVLRLEQQAGVCANGATDTTEGRERAPSHA